MTSTTSNVEGHKEADDLLEEFLADAQLQGLTDGTRSTYRSQLKYFIDWIDKDPRAVDRSDLKPYLAHLTQERKANDGTIGLKPSTVNGIFSAINSFYKFLTYEGYAQDNPVPPFRDRYLDGSVSSTDSPRQLISVEEMSMLAHATLAVRDRAVILVLAKTGIRRGELVQIDVSDINWDDQSIRLKPTAKRSNSEVFFDGECARVLQRWLDSRDMEDRETEALFTNQFGTRLKRSGIYNAVTNRAESVGLHDPDSDDPQDRFTPHCCRHWFTTHLRKSGMKREFIKELRGDTRGDAIDIYDHIDRDELRQAYLAHIPTLGL